jgi:NAD(P)H-hydrate repair Nnr-like enzyme with NAD(P)H-hydrate epimerase domain
MHTEERIGEAWRLHRSGNNNASIKIFEEILDKTPNNIDALYGLGLARRAEGNNSGAIEAFKAAQTRAKEALDAIDVTSGVDGHHGANDLDTYEDDRFLMLQRMIAQRLEELES